MLVRSVVLDEFNRTYVRTYTRTDRIVLYILNEVCFLVIKCFLVFQFGFSICVVSSVLNVKAKKLLEY